MSVSSSEVISVQGCMCVCLFRAELLSCRREDQPHVTELLIVAELLPLKSRSNQKEGRNHGGWILVGGAHT